MIYLKKMKAFILLIALIIFVIVCSCHAKADTYSPYASIVAGGITKEGDAFLNPIREKIKKDISIKISKLQNDAGIVGAAMLGIYKA